MRINRETLKSILYFFIDIEKESKPSESEIKSSSDSSPQNHTQSNQFTYIKYKDLMNVEKLLHDSLNYPIIKKFDFLYKNQEYISKQRDYSFFHGKNINSNNNRNSFYSSIQKNSQKSITLSMIQEEHFVEQILCNYWELVVSIEKLRWIQQYSEQCKSILKGSLNRYFEMEVFENKLIVENLISTIRLFLYTTNQFYLKLNLSEIPPIEFQSVSSISEFWKKEYNLILTPIREKYSITIPEEKAFFNLRVTKPKEIIYIQLSDFTIQQVFQIHESILVQSLTDIRKIQKEIASFPKKEISKYQENELIQKIEIYYKYFSAIYNYFKKKTVFEITIEKLYIQNFSKLITSP